MKRSLQCLVVLGCTLVILSLTPYKTRAQDRGEHFSRQQTGNSPLEGPAIQMLVTERVSRRDLRTLVTSSRTVDEHPNLAEYYRHETARLLSESKEYEKFAQAAGDTKPLSEPNHYGVSRSARFDYLAAKDKLRRAHDAKLLAALNAQAEQGKGCYTCHSFHGRGGKIGPDLAVEGTRKRTDAWLIGHFKDPQAVAPSSVMPALGGLTNHQLEVLSAFLHYQK